MENIIVQITAVGQPYISMALELMEDIYLLNAEPGFNIKFFVFTDNVRIFKETWSNYHTIIKYDQFKGIANSVERFDQMLRIEEGLGSWILRVDADMKALPTFKIKDIIDQCPDDQHFIPVLHPGYFNLHPSKYPYDWNLDEMSSTKTTPYRYYCGGLQFYRNNKEGRAFLQKLKDTTEIYKAIVYTPLWNDESIFNALVPDVNYYLDPSYCFPDNAFSFPHLYQNILHLEPKLIALTKGL